MLRSQRRLIEFWLFVGSIASRNARFIPHKSRPAQNTAPGIEYRELDRRNTIALAGDGHFVVSLAKGVRELRLLPNTSFSS
jgi:hypothetical protein